MKDPKKNLREMCSFLGVDCDEGYLDACAGVAADFSRERRQELDWTDEGIAWVQAKIDQFGFLKGYSLDQ
ncbi:MAG: hypothetical protein ACREH5_00170 [Candidatus Omnitrophota bacterium]